MGFITILTAGLFKSISILIVAFILETASDYFDKLFSDPCLAYFIIIFTLLAIIRGSFDRLMKMTFKHRIDENHDDSPGFQYDVKQRKSNLAIGKKVLTLLVIAAPVFYLGYVAVAGTEMQGYVMQWLNLIVRWTHVVVGIMWIGASFYFIFLENNLNRTEGIRNELAGNLWAIHGGGFYFLEKYKVAPKKIPRDLHWFKYEAYLTWISGFVLLWIVYYIDPRSFLINPAVADISAITAISIGIGILIIGWFVYDFMCKSRLIQNQLLFSLTGLVLLTALSYFLVNIFSSRGAYIHVGALIGTLMAGNVFFIIIPSQKALVRAAISGEPLDATLGTKAQQRSLHNNYLTLPVIFIMISNHFPATFAHDYNWLILMGIIIASAGIKHYWNLAERGVKTKYILPMSVAGLLAIALVSSPMAEGGDPDVDLTIPTTISDVQLIIQARCIQCHSVNPTDQIWRTAPGDIKLDTKEEIQRYADQIMQTTVRTNAMPLGNLTNMTEEERIKIHRWISQGAKIED
ncbi:MAG: urate hydroxylase PuuD [Balneolaceae bacterium]